MTKNLSLKLQENIFMNTETIIKQLNIPRNKYINDAIAFYNEYNRRELLKELLRKDSELVRENSMEYLRLFEALEDEIPE